MRLANGSEVRFLDEPEGRFISINDLISSIEQVDRIMGKPSDTWVQKTVRGFVGGLKAIRDVK